MSELVSSVSEQTARNWRITADQNLERPLAPRESGPAAEGERGGLAVKLLGRLEIGAADGAVAPVAQPMQRVLLGLLATARGRAVSADALVDGLWGEEWSRERERNLHSQVSALRRRLAEADPGAGARLERSAGGYRLAAADDELDAGLFRRLARDGREAARAGDAAGAAATFGRGLGLWRGPALADAAPLCARLAAEAASLEEMRAGVVEERAECQLAVGRHLEAAGELSELAAEHPGRERLTSLLMVALWRCGRRGDALAAFERTRRALAEELGLDPGPGLREVQAQVLADDPSLAGAAASRAGSASVQPAAAPAAAGRDAVRGRGRAREGPHAMPRQLPAGAGYFAGRLRELKALDELAGQVTTTDDPATPAGLAVTGITGMAGVGKTALAVQWARTVADRFPDGQLFADLRGYDADAAPVTAQDVMVSFLAALGMPAAAMPAGSGERAGLYRSVLAGCRVLMVLDNARDAAHVRPLLAGGPGCLAIVTSRSSLTGLAAADGARLLPLDPMTADEAAVLLGARLGAQRLACEPTAVTELITRCGHLPLAMAVMAARAAAAPVLTLAALAAELADAAAAERAGTAGARGRLDALDTGDPATSLRELLSWSRARLSPSAADMLALLGSHWGPDISVATAASLAATSRADARRALAELAEVSLIAEHRPGRYTMHDLIRGYAAEQQRPTALHRPPRGGAPIPGSRRPRLMHIIRDLSRPCLLA
jgi:DNA-binding SARP family transcriptional activator